MRAASQRLFGVSVGELRRGEERREQLLALDELDEVGGPLRGQVVVEDALLALALEPVDGRAQQPPRLVVELLRVVGVRVEEQAVGRPAGRSGATGGEAVMADSLGRAGCGACIGLRDRTGQTRDRRVRRGRTPWRRLRGRWCLRGRRGRLRGGRRWRRRLGRLGRRRRGLRDGHRGRRRLPGDGAGLGRLRLRRRCRCGRSRRR